MVSFAIAMILHGCVGAGSPSELVLEGPTRVEVGRYGPVAGPVAVVEGEEAAQIQITVTPETVAHVRDGELHAIGPGEAIVRASWNEQSVEWTLVVEPPASVAFVSPPATIAVGESEALSVSGGAADALTWASSKPEIATVDATGKVTGVAAGLVYITASADATEAMLELRVE